MDKSPSNLIWRKSTLSGTNNDDCVEVANLPSGGQAVRDSKNPNGPMLNFTHTEWRTFIINVKNGEFDRK
ncbi:DUF397 domain-containing protein [Streptosporangium sp. NBC_01755]|uniref:DUF397 domain-containing protein n=1 Tax=unclassified Streptosporangium TaxID=2632669 RepID=UPI002DD7F9F3|nr:MULTISPECIES: DUF397 domain-containing protein [unclassified Streptosporangium]WSA26299.1 DUF397 domain-containing protein [Streptosporangium sp. NBC_01810]WSD02273.1 DUF397 domain-containing protein [Streptosporangium sp. NBC_01755]